MVNLILLGLAVLAGYVVTVGFALVCTIALASAAPRFVVADHRLRESYKLAHGGIWLLSTMAGAYVTARVGMGIHPVRQEILLIAVLLTVLWRNSWEARQRGISHQIFISVLTVVGIFVAFACNARMPR